MLIILILALFIFATIICLINHTYHPANEQSLFNIIYDRICPFIILVSPLLLFFLDNENFSLFVSFHTLNILDFLEIIITIKLSEDTFSILFLENLYYENNIT